MTIKALYQALDWQVRVARLDGDAHTRVCASRK